MDDNDDENDEEEEVIDDEHNNINIDDVDDMRMVSMHHGRAKTTILEKDFSQEERDARNKKYV